jgi:hypothetical protein
MLAPGAWGWREVWTPDTAPFPASSPSARQKNTATYRCTYSCRINYYLSVPFILVPPCCTNISRVIGVRHEIRHKNRLSLVKEPHPIITNNSRNLSSRSPFIGHFSRELLNLKTWNNDFVLLQKWLDPVMILRLFIWEKHSLGCWLPLVGSRNGNFGGMDVLHPYLQLHVECYGYLAIRVC